MRKLLLIFLFLGQAVPVLLAQPSFQAKQSPSQSDFTAIQAFLSSGWMEGREAGARGGFMAADYIASMMQVNGLQPYGDEADPDHGMGTGSFSRTYFQNFTVIRYHLERSSLAVVSHSSEGESALHLEPGSQYVINPVPFGSEAETAMVFAGYGIAAPEKGYDDYRGIDVNHRVVIILDGYPGHQDTSAYAARNKGKGFGAEAGTISRKLRLAGKLGAVGVIVINRHENSPEPVYEDPEYYLPGDTSLSGIPCFRLGSGYAKLLMSGTGIDLPAFERRAAADASPVGMVIRDKTIRFSVIVKSEAVTVRNVMGLVGGTDTTRNIIIGAHYDHLGTRNGVIYNGADDNASGVAGMLALSKIWAEAGEKPSCNLIFAAWTAEEKGLLGSSYFASHSAMVPEGLSLVINMDMISRSAPEDSNRRQVSIGTLPRNKDLKEMATACNSHLDKPFTLDLWDVTGHTGSDYGPFAARKIPVMTFFSGFHADYHTPRDVVTATDPGKMEKILKIVNDCIRITSSVAPER
jgi:hypothetical protein